uniref:Phosphodiesterase n=1 Tax=Culicoides sonorensis TaxID=179676 RepID=A0A336MZQ1_CULSO
MLKYVYFDFFPATSTDVSPCSDQHQQPPQEQYQTRYQLEHRRLSDTDRPLLEALMRSGSTRRHSCTGRFLTMHKRRRKKLSTRNLAIDQAILDDVLHGQVQCILDHVGNWRFNAFTLETVTGGRSLPVLCVHLFHWYGLLDHFNLDVVRVWKLFSLIEEGYHSTNPYHNSIHATDVTQAMHCFLQEKKILKHLEPLEIMAALIGAVTHDLDHPGVNQPFLIATSNHLAALYKNASVLENHHWRSAIGCLLESGVAEQIQSIRPELEEQIQSLILATDITRQQEFLTRLKRYLDPPASDNDEIFDMSVREHRLFILQIALKCADISNPCRPWDISKKWSQKVCEEFFRQGDFERQLNLPVTSLCDRQSTSVPKIQSGFFKFVVTPLMDEWHRFLKTDLSYKMMGHLKYNQNQWEGRLQAEIAEETRTEISDAEMFDDVDEAEIDEPCLDISDSSETLLPQILLPPNVSRRSSLQVTGFINRSMPKVQDRRMSVPLHPVPKIILPPKDNSPPHAIQEYEENDHIKFDQDSLSILSSDSDSGPRRSSAGSTEKERPLSAENLLPDCSIASMSDSAHADRLNLVLHGASSANTYNTLGIMNTSKHLVRQQTFPPLQPYIRTRYMSSTAELGACPEALVESRSTSSSGSQTDFDNTRSGGSATILSTKKESIKRKQHDSSGNTDRSSKHANLAANLPGQKENLDPSKLRKSGSTRRRGSAPVTVGIQSIKAEPSDSTSTNVGLYVKTDDKLRRGSMPAEVITINAMDFLEPSSAVPDYAINSQRRSSVPVDPSSLRSNNGKRRNKNKILRRRSSGGPEQILLESSSSSGSTWLRIKRAAGDAVSRTENQLAKRRGSLPADVLTIGYSSKDFLIFLLN